MLALGAIAGGLKGLMVCAGVPKAGEEEGIGFAGAGVSGALNIAAVLGFPVGRDLLIVLINRKFSELWYRKTSRWRDRETRQKARKVFSL